MPFKFSRKIQSLAAFPILATIALTPASALPASSVKVTHVVIMKHYVVYNGLAE
jgi:hypothetical protein